MSYITARSSVAPMPIVRAVPSSSAGARSSRRRPWEGPAAGEDTADESVVDAELAVLAVRPLLGGAGVAVHVAGVAGIGVDEDELADVVKQRREHEPVAVLVAELGGGTLCGALGGAGRRRKRSGVASHRPLRSKKSKVRVRVTMVWTASGESASTALPTLSTSPRALPSMRLARRMTEMARATSVSTAATMSAADVRSSPSRRSRRLRDSARAGKASSASNAAVRRRPWSPLWRPSAARSRRWGHASERQARPGYRQSGCNGLAPCERRVDTTQRFLTAQQRDGLEDPGRHGSSRQCHAQRLEDLVRLDVALFHHAPERLLDVLEIERLGVGQRRAGRRKVVGAAVGADDLVERIRVVFRAVEDEGGEGLEVGQRLHLLLGDGDRALDAGAAGELLEPSDEIVASKLAQVPPVHPPQLLLVEDGRVAGDAVEAEALDHLVGAQERRFVVVAPAEQRDVVAHRLGQVAGVAQLLDGGGAVTL